MHSYALWNNKGGVGKSTITFHLAMRYAELHSNRNVLVIDLCPQANSSMMLLGGGPIGEQYLIDLCSEATPKSVVGYLSTVISSGRGASLPNPSDYIIKVNKYNSNVPENLYLLCGDGNLEPMAPAINEAASAKSLTPKDKPWKWIQEIIKKFISNVTTNDEKDWLVLVDTNPSFSIYTQIAISGVERILTPINADDSSKTAASALIALLHGTIPPHPIYGSWTYAAMAAEQGINIPKIHLLIGNRLTQFEGSATAYGALSDATASSLFDIFKIHPEYFVSRTTAIATKESFIANYSKPLRDFNTAGVVCAHLGRLLSSMSQGYYPVYGESVKVNADKIKECIKAIDAIASII
ncbi:AAA family ATPase [Anaerocolumna sedimenticola]|uniref:AAA family ATPase n=1 Tax=Anaerocolumna sedimenticola TaxID=2696063 RepID=A0A6P1TWC9_9FIRM|nr:AAA family ATPase [Anaerocolumna sedimenticola]